MHYLSYKSSSLTNTPTPFGARRRLLQGVVPSQLLTLCGFKQLSDLCKFIGNIFLYDYSRIFLLGNKTVRLVVYSTTGYQL